MKHCLAAFLLTTLFGFAPAEAQGPEPVQPEILDGGDSSLEEKAPPIPMPFPPAPENQAAEEILKLFQKVDRSLGSIDSMLFDLGAGERPLEAPTDSGLGDLLELTRAASESVVEDIDRILELAESMAKSQQSSSSSGGGQQQGPSPKGKKPKQGNQKSEQPESKQDEPSQGQGEQPKPASPEGPEESDETGQNQASDHGQQHPTGAGSQADQAERWGELPVRVRETFRNQGGDDAPLYYRDWIDSYYRHLSKGDG